MKGRHHPTAWPCTASMLVRRAGLPWTTHSIHGIVRPWLQKIDCPRSTRWPRQSFFPALTRKKAEGVTEAVEAYLAGISPDGAQRVLAAVARLLAITLEEAPGYARARLAAELRGVLAELGSQVHWENELAERRERREQDRAWAAADESLI